MNSSPLVEFSQPPTLGFVPSIGSNWDDLSGASTENVLEQEDGGLFPSEPAVDLIRRDTTLDLLDLEPTYVASDLWAHLWARDLRG